MDDCTCTIGSQASRPTITKRSRKLKMYTNKLRFDENLMPNFEVAEIIYRVPGIDKKPMLYPPSSRRGIATVLEICKCRGTVLSYKKSNHLGA